MRERIGVLALVDTYDIFDSEAGNRVGIAVEQVSGIGKLLRLVVGKRFLPTRFDFFEVDEKTLVLSVHRGWGILRLPFAVFDAMGREMWRLRSKFLALREGIQITDSTGKHVAEVRGNWTGFEFQLLTTDRVEIGHITKKWGGLLKETFTNADSYFVSVGERSGLIPQANARLLAASVAIDAAYNERE